MRVGLAEAIRVVLACERAEDPRPRLPDGELIDLVRAQVGVGNTGEISFWLASGVVDRVEAAAYKVVLTATTLQLAAVLRRQ